MSERAGRLAIAIDGPAASGKSTLGAALAARLGYTYFDSGVMYRALTWLALERGVNVLDEGALVRLAETAAIQVTRPEGGSSADGRQFTLLVDGCDATWAIRTPEVDHHVSAVSAHPAVRRAITERLRQIAAGGGMVMVGRDIGTVVLPNADLKLYLTASGEERARRRHRELAARSLPADYTQILAEMRRRDALDSSRETAPLRPAADAVVLDSDTLTVDEEIDLVLRHLAQRAVALT
jgi:CMP/dCMP kinase